MDWLPPSCATVSHRPGLCIDFLRERKRDIDVRKTLFGCLSQAGKYVPLTNNLSQDLLVLMLAHTLTNEQPARAKYGSSF